MNAVASTAVVATTTVGFRSGVSDPLLTHNWIDRRTGTAVTLRRSSASTFRAVLTPPGGKPRRYDCLASTLVDAGEHVRGLLSLIPTANAA